MTDLIPNDLGHFEGNEVPQDFEYNGVDIDDDLPCGDYAHSGICPCCGGYVRTIGGNYDNDPMWDECDTCDWKGNVEYD